MRLKFDQKETLLWLALFRFVLVRVVAKLLPYVHFVEPYS